MTIRDDIDRRILRALQADGRCSNATLAARVGLSASACLRRVQELERHGTIRGYRAVTDPGQTDRGFAVYVTIGLSSHTKTALADFERAMQAAPEVAECHKIAGAFEFLLRVETADMAAYKRFHGDVLGTQPHIGAITSYIVMDSPKDTRA